MGSIFLSIEHCAVFLKNARTFIQIVHTSKWENSMMKAQLLKLKIYFLCCRVPYGVSGAAFYRKLRHEESSHNFRSQPVVVVFFYQTCSRPRASECRQLCQWTWQWHDFRNLSNIETILCWQQSVRVMLRILELEVSWGISYSSHNKLLYRKCYYRLLPNAWREKVKHTNKRKALSFFIFSYHDLNTKYVNLWQKQI